MVVHKICRICGRPQQVDSATRLIRIHPLQNPMATRKTKRTTARIIRSARFGSPRQSKPAKVSRKSRSSCLVSPLHLRSSVSICGSDTRGVGVPPAMSRGPGPAPATVPISRHDTLHSEDRAATPTPQLQPLLGVVRSIHQIPQKIRGQIGSPST